MHEVVLIIYYSVLNVETIIIDVNDLAIVNYRIVQLELFLGLLDFAKPTYTYHDQHNLSSLCGNFQRRN